MPEMLFITTTAVSASDSTCVIPIYSLRNVLSLHGLGDRGVGVQVPVGSRISLLHIVQTGCRFRPTSYRMGTGALSPRVKRPGHEADHLPRASAGKDNVDLYIHAPIRLHGLVLS
jgi:hypothetical protein